MTTSSKKGEYMSLMINVPTQAELDSYLVIAKTAAASPYWRKQAGDCKPDEAIATLYAMMLLGRELGFSPIQSVSGGIHNIQGKFELSARFMNMAIRARGHKMNIEINNDDICRIWGQRKDTGEEAMAEFTIEEARRCGLVRAGSPWTKTPSDMLFARALSRIARRLFPDCIGNCYVEGEIQEMVLNKPMESAPELPKEEIIHVQPTVQLNLPEEVSKERADEFISQTAVANEKSVKFITERAVKNMGEFVKQFKKWEEKQYSLPIHEDLRTANSLGV
jgi:hypothetical protein